MKFLYLILFVIVSVKSEGHESLDVDGLLSDPKNFENIAGCFLDKAPCDDISASLKKDLPVVIDTSCEKCTPKEKHIVKVFFDAFAQAPKVFEAFKDKYDPERKYIAKLEAAVAKS